LIISFFDWAKQLCHAALSSDEMIEASISMQIDRCDVNLLIFLVVTPYGYRLLFILLILNTNQDENLPSRTIMEVRRNVAFYKLGA
jgi:hypothetical protein